MARLRPLLALVLPAALAWPSQAQATAPLTPPARAALAHYMRMAGPYTGALVADATTGSVLFAWRPDVARVPASNEKLYTTATALLRFGPYSTLSTRVLGPGSIDSAGTYSGNLYLRGGGDPTFGTYAFTRRNYGTGATVTLLAYNLSLAGVRHVQGSIVGDESLFDTRRGGRSFLRDPYLGGSISGLSFDRGLFNSGATYLGRPAAFAAAQLTSALRARGISVSGAPAQGVTPAGLHELARVESPTIATLAGLTIRPSDNYFAETLLKDLGAYFGGAGTTATGASVVRVRLAGFGIHPAVYDGSGLSRLNRTTPRQVTRLLTGMSRSFLRTPFDQALSVAGRSGTLAYRMRGTVAAGRCRGKTGTLIGVSALSGYCDALGGRRLVFSFLMNGVNVYRARALQDAMASVLARDRAPAAVSPATAPAAAARR